MREIYHHGILGQKWGVRRFQNEDGTLTEEGRTRYKGQIRKKTLLKEQLGISVKRQDTDTTDGNESKSLNLDAGSKVYHVTPNDFKQLRDGQDLFISATDYDRNMYKSFLTMMMKHKGYGMESPIKEVELTLSKSVKSPDNETQRKLFNKVYGTEKELIDSELDLYYSKGATRPKDTYDAFIKTLDSKPTQSKALFYKELSLNGYNAVLDQHDVTGSWMRASRPLILMDALNTIGNITVRDINTKDIEESLQKLKIL